MMQRLFLALSIALLCSILNPTTGAAVDRIYMGEQACRECHHSPERNQFNTWRLTKHAEAYASLAKPESKEIARISGVDEDPFKSPICLGCHTTAYYAEEWQRDEHFRFEDGVQCEKCHGAGSEYITVDTMANHIAAMKAGLQKYTQEDCLVCHKDKPSHSSVIPVKPFVFGEAIKEISHKGRSDQMPDPPLPVKQTALLDGPKYVGAYACATCHDRSDQICSIHSWRMSRHSQAYAILGTPLGASIARKEGVDGNPQESKHCLQCHSTAANAPAGQTMPAFDIAQGVQCESCHGAGSEYMSDAVMRDVEVARHAGLKDVTKETCLTCHTPGIHGKDFQDEWFDTLIHRVQSTQTVNEPPVYKTPWNLAVSRDGNRLFVACEASDSLMVLDPLSGTILAEIAVGNQPNDVCLSPDGKFAYVSNRASDTISVVDTQSYAVICDIAVGDEPHGMTTNTEGSILYVANASTNDISVVDLKQRKEIKRLAAGRGAWDVARSPDGKQVFVTNNLSHFVGYRESSLSEVTAIETERSIIRHRHMLLDTNLVQGVDFAPDGEFAMVTLLRTKNLVPMTRVMQGWVITNGIGVIWKNGRVDQLLLDEVDDFFPDPTDLVITRDGKYAFVTGGGIDSVAVIDLLKMKALLQSATDQEREEVFPNHLGLSMEYVIKRISVGKSPRGMCLSPDGKYLYVADGLDDAVSVIDIEKLERVRIIDLGGPKEITLERWGEQIFHNASVTYGNQFSCHTCHPDGHIDGITYDIEADGLGFNPVDNRTLRGIIDTAPFKWNGKNATLSRQCGPRLAVFFTRLEPFTPEQVKAVDRYITTITRPPNRYRHAELTPAQRRGKAIYERTHTNMGDEIPKSNRCTFCHPAPYFTNRELSDVTPPTELDTQYLFDVPHLNNIYDSAPYLHDGRANTLEEIWTVHNPYDKHGVTNDMTKDQLNDLIEYIKTF